MSTYRQTSAHPDWSIWQLAREAHRLRRIARLEARHGDDAKTRAERQIHAAFTADEIQRVDAYLAANTPDVDRLASIESRLAGSTDDTKWLAEQLKQAWAQMDELRDRIDTAGSLMHSDLAASAIDYIPMSRTEASR